MEKKEEFVLSYKHVSSNKPPELLKNMAAELLQKNNYLKIFVRLMFQTDKITDNVFSNITNEIDISPNWKSRCSLGVNIIELDINYNEISYYYVKNADLTCPFHNYPFHEMPLMSIYSAIFHAIHSKKTEVVLGIKQLLDDDIIVHWMIDAVFNAKLMFRNVYNLEGNYACLLYTSPSPRDQRGSRMPSSA